MMANGNALRLAVFDCDGTLVDSLGSIVMGMEHAFKALGLEPPTPNVVRKVVGLPLLEAIKRVSPGHDAATYEQIRAAYARMFSELRAEDAEAEDLYPGTVEALDSLESDSWLLGVATGKARRGLEATLVPHGLSARFLTKQTSDVAAGKPAPDMLYQAMNETGADASRTVMIGDTTYDMEMARNAGTFAVGVAWGYHEEDDLWAAGAHMVVRGYSELPGALAKLVEA